MKKTLAAVAILGAFAGSAMADVTVYGRIDTGFLYNDDGTNQTVTMENGQSTGSRWGIKGSHQLAEGVKAGFVLEARLYGDTGVEGKDGKAFERESVVYVASNYGTVYAGRINSFWSDGGSVAMFSNYAAFGTGSNVGYGTGMMVGHGRTDNTVAYVSPSMGGVKVYAEYAAGADKAEFKAAGDQHAGVGVEYKAGAFGLAFAAMQDNEKGSVNDDLMTINLAATYDFGCAKAYLAGQYYEGADKAGKFDKVGVAGEDLEGYAVNLGADVPMAGGKLTVGGTYAAGENQKTGAEYDGYNVAVQYVYPFSKQVQAYAGVGYTKLESEGTEFEAKLAMAGMVVRF